MDLKQILEQDPRLIEMKQKYQYLMGMKQRLIVDISHLEADIIKLTGSYETLTKEIVEQIKKGMETRMGVPQEPAPVEPPEEQVAEENQDDGFAEAPQPTEPSPIPPSAENVRPEREEE